MVFRMRTDDLVGRMAQVYDRYLKSGGRERASSALLLKESRDYSASLAPIVPENSMQDLLRPIYGKGPTRPVTFGDHPDYTRLRGTNDTALGATVTLFMDIEGSTRLPLHYDLGEVRRIKNAFMTAAIEAVASFNGHVHRLMGDAVMAFFGRKGVPIEQAVIDALNAASVIRFFVDAVIIPALKREGMDDPFGIRIGIDYGPEDKVLWGSYGYPGGAEEVTATSFHVDVAAKLQHAAGRNQIMIGQSLRRFVDVPEELLEVKTVQRAGEQVAEPFVLPNYSLPDGGTHNYEQRRLRWDKYLTYNPALKYIPELLPITAAYGDEKHGSTPNKLYACSTVVPKNKWILFRAQLPRQPKLPYVALWRVENHGEEAAKARELRHQTAREIKMDSGLELLHWESTKYRGLHYLILEIKRGSTIEMSGRFGVWVK